MWILFEKYILYLGNNFLIIKELNIRNEHLLLSIFLAFIPPFLAKKSTVLIFWFLFYQEKRTNHIIADYQQKFNDSSKK